MDYSLKSIFYNPTEAGKRKRELLNLPRETLQSKKAAFASTQGDIVHWGNSCTLPQNSLAGFSTDPAKRKWYQDIQGKIGLVGYVEKPIVSVRQVLANKNPSGPNIFAGTAGTVTNLVSRVGQVQPFAILTPEQGQYADSSIGLYPFNTHLNPNDPMSMQFTRKLFDIQNNRLALVSMMNEERKKALNFNEYRKNRQFHNVDKIMNESADLVREELHAFAAANIHQPTTKVHAETSTQTHPEGDLLDFGPSAVVEDEDDEGTLADPLNISHLFVRTAPGASRATASDVHGNMYLHTPSRAFATPASAASTGSSEYSYSILNSRQLASVNDTPNEIHIHRNTTNLPTNIFARDPGPTLIRQQTPSTIPTQTPGRHVRFAGNTGAAESGILGTPHPLGTYVKGSSLWGDPETWELGDDGIRRSQILNNHGYEMNAQGERRLARNVKGKMIYSRFRPPSVNQVIASNAASVTRSGVIATDRGGGETEQQLHGGSQQVLYDPPTTGLRRRLNAPTPGSGVTDTSQGTPAYYRGGGTNLNMMDL